MATCPSLMLLVCVLGLGSVRGAGGLRAGCVRQCSPIFTFFVRSFVRSFLCGLEQIFVLLFANGAVPPVASLAAMLWTAGRLEVPLLRGTCAIDDGAFAVRGVQAAVGFEEAKYSGFAGSTVPATPPIPAGSDYVTCDLTGDFHEHPYAFNFTDVHGASARCLSLSVSLSQRSLA